MLVLLLTLASLSSLFVGTLLLKRALALTATATSYIRSAAQGYVALAGEGFPPPGRTITAPFSGKPCVWWSTQVESLLGPATNENLTPNPDAFNKHYSTDQFLLRDGTGVCRVDPAEADVRAQTRELWYGNLFEESSLRVARRSRGPDDLFRFVEERIELHQLIHARGYFQTQDDNGTKAHTLYRPPDGRSFLLTTVREDVLAKRLRLQAVLALSLCVALATCAVYASSG